MQIASLFASIGADTSGLQKGLKDSENAIKKTAKSVEKSGESFNFAAMATGFNQALEIVNKIGNAIKAVYAAASEGAAIEYAAQKFDNLSRSIGTTSDALLMDLRSAVKGTMSDMELMAGASDMLALGLAKSHDQAVRLTAVAGALGWNMDQLTLTITNETTMRLDSLGLSIESVKGRYEALKAAGIDGQQAMTQAVIEAGEAMITLQGHVGDTTLGAFQKMEASQANFFATLKADLAEGMTWWAEFWSKAYDSSTAHLEVDRMSKALQGAFEIDPRKFYEVIEYEPPTSGWEKFVDKLFFGTTGQAERATDFYNMKLEEMGVYSRKAGFELETVISGLEGVELAMFKTKFDEKKWFASTAYREDLTKYAEGLQGIQYALDRTGATYDAYGDQQEAAVRQYEEMAAAREQALADRVIANQERLRQWREELHRTAEALRTDLADAYIQVSIAEQGWREGVSGDLKGRLDEEFERHKISLDKYKASLDILDRTYGTNYVMQFEMGLAMDDLFRTLLENPEDFADAAGAFEDYFMPLDAAVQASMELVDDLQARLSELERTYDAKVNIVIATYGYGSTGSLPIGGDEGGGGGSKVPQFAHAMGGYELAGQPYLVGEAGPELFIPDTNGRVYSNASSGAMMGGGNGDLLAALGRLPTASDIAMAVRDALLMVGA